MWHVRDDRYDSMQYRRCGRSGLLLPSISLGLWHNFGDDTPEQTKRAVCRTAFDLGITHFDLANNYGPPPGSAEEAFGRILRTDFAAHRDELVISSPAGYPMWPGPYGDWGSRKYLVASCDQSLKRLGVDYVDIFYSHRFDPNTPLEETMMALDAQSLEQLGTPCLIQQPIYTMLNRWVEEDCLLDVLEPEGIGAIVFSPLAQGMLTNKYLGDVPLDSRLAQQKTLRAEFLTEQTLANIRELNGIAARRGQTLAQMALAWVLRDPRVSSALIGASRPEQVEDCVGALDKLDFDDAELTEIERYARDAGINLWAESAELEAPSRK
ncbi:MAG: aldo/keto reductase [Acidihalobacter sp.]